MKAPQSDMIIRQARRRVLWLAAFFFLPLALSFLIYYGDLWRPKGTTNKGDLIAPARPLPEIALTLADGTQSAPDTLRGKWTWAYIGNGQCDTRCREALTDIRQARLLLVEKMDRVQRAFFATGECCDMEYLRKEHPGLIVARFEKPTFTAPFALNATDKPETAGRIYLIDPLGNLMMSYAPDAPSMGLLEDIKKLLNLSHIG
jgi:cytochrome oxidase Cu insertion factor (SCO1/SenC/PrrC family)